MCVYVRVTRVFMCMPGMCVFPLAPEHSQIIGDALCLLGAFLYATSNVCEEYLVKRVAVTEFLGMLGFMASGICGVLM